MTSPNLQAIHTKLNDLVKFVETHRRFLNNHIINIFTEDLWKKHIPKAIQEELHTSELRDDFVSIYHDIVNVDEYPQDVSKKFPNTCSFLKSTKEISIKNDLRFITSLNNLENVFNFDAGNKISLKGFGSEKKLHEVERMSQIISSLSKHMDTSHVLDIGGGKGYLSSLLALHYNLKVLGVDCSEITTTGAVKRSKKLVKYWKTVAIPADQNDNIENKKVVNKEYLDSLYKQTVAYVTSEMDLSELIMQNFKEKCSGLALTGLHTCGNLGPTSVKMFVRNDIVKVIVNVGCCYHLINEEFYTHSFWNGIESSSIDGEYGFPMSKFLKEKEFYLGRNTRMLGAYSLERMGDSYYDESSEKSAFYRAVLETILDDGERNFGRSGQVSKLWKNCNNFHEYMHKALQKLEKKEMSSDEISELYNVYKDKESLVKIYHYFRVSMSEVVESILLLDRLLYLLENGVKNAYIIPLFDPKISPRSYAIVAWKNNEEETLNDFKKQRGLPGVIETPGLSRSHEEIFGILETLVFRMESTMMKEIYHFLETFSLKILSTLLAIFCLLLRKKIFYMKDQGQGSIKLILL